MTTFHVHHHARDEDTDADIIQLHRMLHMYLEDSEIGVVTPVSAASAPAGSRSAGGTLFGYFTVVASAVISGTVSSLVTIAFQYFKQSGRPVTISTNGIEVTVDQHTAKRSPELVATLLDAARSEESSR